MLERAGARFWISIVAGVIVFPVAVVVLLAAWIVSAQVAAPPVVSATRPVTVAIASPIPSVQRTVEVAVPPQRAAVAEPIAPPTIAPTPEPASTTPTVGLASSTDVDRAQQAKPQDGLPQEVVPQEAPPQDASAREASPSVSPATAAEPIAPEPAEPIVGAVSPAPALVEAAEPPRADTVAERFAPASDAKAPEPTPALSVLATLALVPPKFGSSSAHADPAQDTSPSQDTSVSPTMTVKPAALEISETASGLVPLPRPKPRVVVANVSRVVPLPRPRPAGSSAPHDARPPR
jgi:nicotinate-nucleotide--dimethylbenzimidazole phosphoribosyltransferase